MRTIIAIVIGLVALGAVIVLSKRSGKSPAVAAQTFIWIWLIACAIDWAVGVYQGYSPLEELGIHAAIFGVPAIAAIFVSRASKTA